MAAPAKVAKQEGKNNHETADERAGKCQFMAEDVAILYIKCVLPQDSADPAPCVLFHTRSPFHFVPASSKHGSP